MRAARTGERGADLALGIAAGVATAGLIAFVLLPIVAIFLRVPPGRLIAQLHSRVALQALGVSFDAVDLFGE